MQHSSDRQQAANRLNAQKSTGPATPEGKTVSSQNSFKHGFASDRFWVLSHESQQDFDQYTANLLADFKPQTSIEKTLIKKMAQHYWLSQRAVWLQETCFQENPIVTREGTQRELALYLRYQSQHDRAFHKSLADLQKIQALRQNERRKEEVHAIRLIKLTPSKPKPIATPAVVIEETEAIQIAA